MRRQKTSINLPTLLNHNFAQKAILLLQKRGGIMEKTKNIVTPNIYGQSQFKLTNQIIKNLSQFDLTPTAKLVLIYLTTCFNPQKADIFPKQKTIAAKIGVSERSIVRAIQELFNAGLIIIECKYSNRYRFTSKLAYCTPQNDIFFDSDRMSDDKCQNDNKQNDNLAEHEHTIEQKKEQPVSIKEFELLKNYAQKKGARNIDAYVNWLIKKNHHFEILKNIKNEKTSSQNRITATQEYLKSREIEKEKVAPLPPEWFELGKKLFNRQNSLSEFHRV